MEVAAAVLLFSGVFALGAVRIFVDGWALWQLWQWFVVPLGAPPIGYWHACGIDLMIGMVLAMSLPRPPDEESGKTIGYAAAKVLIAPLTVGIGLLIHLGMS
jgi:hypothetical protein